MGDLVQEVPERASAAGRRQSRDRHTGLCRYAALVIQHSVSQAKNKMRKTVEAIIDPPPRDVQPIWDYFGSTCAYCGASLSRPDRKAHIDHATAGGGNQLGNLILACSTCNGDEKLDESWREFLRRRAPDDDVYAERERRIVRWIDADPLVSLPNSPAIAQARADLDALIDEFADKCQALRLLVATEGHRPTRSAGRVLSSDGSLHS